MTRSIDWKKRHGEAIKRIVAIKVTAREARLDILFRLRDALEERNRHLENADDLIRHYQHNFGLGYVKCPDCGRGLVVASRGMLVCPACVTELSGQSDRRKRHFTESRANTMSADAPNTKSRQERELQQVVTEIAEIQDDGLRSERSTSRRM